jgi:hypothetical protein
MEINFSKFNLLESVIYRANIFNYDNKFLNSVKDSESSSSIRYECKNQFYKIIYE